MNFRMCFLLMTKVLLYYFSKIKIDERNNWWRELVFEQMFTAQSNKLILFYNFIIGFKNERHPTGVCVIVVPHKQNISWNIFLHSRSISQINGITRTHSEFNFLHDRNMTWINSEFYYTIKITFQTWKDSETKLHRTQFHVCFCIQAGPGHCREGVETLALFLFNDSNTNWP